MSDQKESGTSNYEFAFEKVPESQKKNGLSIFVVLAGYAIALSNFVTGAAIGYKMEFKDAITAILAADAFLIALVIITGLMAFKSGLSTAFLSRKAFGKKGSSIFSVILAISAINWVGINGDTFSKMIVSTFPWWPIPISITAVIIIALWAQSAIRGFKGLEFISWLGVPAAIILSIVCVVSVGAQTNFFADSIGYVPTEGTLTFTQASASVIGSWIFGCVITPDVCRFAKKKKHVAIGGFCAFIIGLFALQTCGILVATATGKPDFISATAALGLSVLVFICTIFCLWTTQDNNIYAASLALQNVFEETKLKGKITHKHIAIGISLFAAVFAFFGALKYLLPIVQTLSVLIAPVPGLLIAENFFIKKSKEMKNVNILAIISWVIGGVCGYIALKANFFISPVVGFIATVILYTVLSKLLDKKCNPEV